MRLSGQCEREGALGVREIGSVGDAAVGDWRTAALGWSEAVSSRREQVWTRCGVWRFVDYCFLVSDR